MADSNTLFLIICSNTKRRGGATTYNDKASLPASLPEWKHKLLDARKSVFELIKHGDSQRDDVSLQRLPRNEHVQPGPDLGGSYPKARYLPACERYFGSFYRAMGQDAARHLAETQHHILILSGLYGLLKPEESIQDYSCHIDDHPKIRSTWDEGLLTNILLAYIKAHSITQVFDFTALSGYRELINWNKVARKVPRVRHAFGRQSVGDGLLSPLGDLLGQALQLKEQKVLNRIASGSIKEVDVDSETICFTEEDHPPAGLPRELPLLDQAAARKDEIVRLARCLKYLLATIDNESGMMEEQDHVFLKLRKDGKIDDEIERVMRDLRKRRNNVEHYALFNASPAVLADQRNDFQKVKKWAKQNGYSKGGFLEC